MFIMHFVETTIQPITVSKDPLFFNIRYEMKQNIIWNEESNYCNGTFLFLLYFVHVNDEERRDLIRKYVKQGMIVEGKRINYVFVVASPIRNDYAVARVKNENERHKDILLSVHEDNYMNITLTHLDAMLWVRDYCRDTIFVGRVDGDVWIHFGNLIISTLLILIDSILVGWDLVELWSMVQHIRGFTLFHLISPLRDGQHSMVELYCTLVM